MTPMSRVHLEGGLHVDVEHATAFSVGSICALWAIGGEPPGVLCLLAADGPVLIPVARIVWVSTIPQPAVDAAPVERGGSGL